MLCVPAVNGPRVAETSGISKIAGGAANLITVVGLAAFFLGLFGPVRNIMFVGIALIVLALVAYFVEEYGPQG